MSPVAKSSAQTPDKVTPLGAFEKTLRLLAGRATIEEGEKTVDYGSFESIITAETEEEMWTADDRGPLGGRDLAGVVMRVDVIDVKWSNSPDIQSPFKDSESGKNIYLLITATRVDDSKYTGKRPDIRQGDTFQWNTSAIRLVAKLLWLEGHEKLSQPVVIEAVELGGGQAVLKLRPYSTGFVNQSGQTLEEASLQSDESPF